MLFLLVGNVNKMVNFLVWVVDFLFELGDLHSIGCGQSETSRGHAECDNIE
jgi:hypothetical protein